MNTDNEKGSPISSVSICVHLWFHLLLPFPRHAPVSADFVPVHSDWRYRPRGIDFFSVVDVWSDTDTLLPICMSTLLKFTPRRPSPVLSITWYSLLSTAASESKTS